MFIVIIIEKIHLINNILSILEDRPINDTFFKTWNSGYLYNNDKLMPKIPNISVKLIKIEKKEII